MRLLLIACLKPRTLGAPSRHTGQLSGGGKQESQVVVAALKPWTLQEVGEQGSRPTRTSFPGLQVRTGSPRPALAPALPLN